MSLLGCAKGTPETGRLPPDGVPVESPVAQAGVDPTRSPRCAPLQPQDVLLIGNSYLILNDTPSMLRDMAAATGVSLHVERVAAGGKNFEYHLSKAATATALSSRSWDVVVLQSHSLDPLRNEDGFLRSGSALIERVRKVGAEPLLFETWPRRRGHKLYRAHGPAGANPEAMHARVAELYERLGAQTDTSVIPVGTAWQTLARERPDIDPYVSDGAHPGETGAYLSAAVLFTTLTRRTPVGKLPPLRSVNASRADILSAVAAKVVDPPCPW